MRNSTTDIDIPLYIHAHEHSSGTCVALMGENTSDFLSQCCPLSARQIRKVDSSVVQVAAGEIQPSAVA